MPDSALTRLAQQIEFIAECDRLKEVFRQTLNTHSRRAENDAEHSWHLCLCVIVLAEHANSPTLDLLRVLKMLIVHDLVEIDAGDTFAYDTAAMATQHAREVVAAERIFGLLPPDQAREFRALWDEFEAKETPEAKFATAVDRFQPMRCGTTRRRCCRRSSTPDTSRAEAREFEISNLRFQTRAETPQLQTEVTTKHTNHPKTPKERSTTADSSLPQESLIHPHLHLFVGFVCFVVKSFRIAPAPVSNLEFQIRNRARPRPTPAPRSP
jgi:putative hydrolase of HD superfamily